MFKDTSWDNPVQTEERELNTVKEKVRDVSGERKVGKGE